MTSTRWASPVIDSEAIRVMRSARAHGPVSLIATPWSDVKTVTAVRAGEIESSKELMDFDQIPLIGIDDQSVKSMFVRGSGVVPLHANMFMAADSPLLTFVETADQQRFRLLIDGDQVFGLVTLSDLQKLPVYSLLFALVIAVEALLVEWIRRTCLEDHDAWLDALTHKRRSTIESYYAQSKTNNVAIDRLSCPLCQYDLLHLPPIVQ